MPSSKFSVVSTPIVFSFRNFMVENTLKTLYRMQGKIYKSPEWTLQKQTPMKLSRLPHFAVNDGWRRGKSLQIIAQLQHWLVLCSPLTACGCTSIRGYAPEWYLGDLCVKGDCPQCMYNIISRVTGRGKTRMDEMEVKYHESMPTIFTSNILIGCLITADVRRH